MESSARNPLTWLTIALLYAWPGTWVMRYNINRRKRRLGRSRPMAD